MRHKSPSALFNVLAIALVWALFTVTVLLPQTLRAQTPEAQNTAPKKIMVFGDSLVAGYGLPFGDAFPAQLEAKLKADGYDITVINAGVSGDTTSAGLTRLDWSMTQKPDYFVLVLGGNDMLRQVDPAVTRANLDKIVEKVRAQNIPVLLAGMRTYSNLDDKGGDGLEKIYQDIATKHGVALYPFFLDGVALDAKYNLNDGIHPNKEGVAIIVDKIYDDIKKLITP